MDKFCDAVFEWNLIEQRYGVAQGPVDRSVYSYHLQCVEIYYKYFRGTRIVGYLPYATRKYLYRQLFIAFIKRCFLITYARNFITQDDHTGYPEDALLRRFELYYQLLPRLQPFKKFFL